eukprot:gene55558-12503_t
MGLTASGGRPTRAARAGAGLQQQLFSIDHACVAPVAPPCAAGSAPSPPALPGR